MRGHRLSGPDQARLRRLIAHGKYEVHEWRAGPGELAPVLAAQPFDREVVPFEKLQRQRIDTPGWMASRAEGFESVFHRNNDRVNRGLWCPRCGSIRWALPSPRELPELRMVVTRR